MVAPKNSVVNWLMMQNFVGLCYQCNNAKLKTTNKCILCLLCQAVGTPGTELTGLLTVCSKTLLERDKQLYDIRFFFLVLCCHSC